jgi:hypothetical protein
MKKYVVKLTLKDGKVKYSAFNHSHSGYLKVYADKLLCAVESGKSEVSLLVKALERKFEASVVKTIEHEFGQKIIDFTIEEFDISFTEKQYKILDAKKEV